MIALSWSGGKDSARALTRLRETGRGPDLLLTTVSEDTGAITHHGVPNELLRAQAHALGLPLTEIPIPPGAGDEEYSERMRAAFGRPPLEDVKEVAFGDLQLADLRAFRERRLAEIGIGAVFPLWGRDTSALAREIAGRYTATIVTLDTRALAPELLGRPYTVDLLAELPAGVDPCGENGEFHTFVSDGPGFGEPVRFATGAVTTEGDFAALALRAVRAE